MNPHAMVRIVAFTFHLLPISNSGQLLFQHTYCGDASLLVSETFGPSTNWASKRFDDLDNHLMPRLWSMPSSGQSGGIRILTEEITQKGIMPKFKLQLLPYLDVVRNGISPLAKSATEGSRDA
jgi:hypothetical protein